MIKTISRSEFRKIKVMLKAYYEHIDANPYSLITRLYGLHMIKWKSFGLPFKKYLVVMSNVF
jgi:1-phosphatidylinositol-4-phosphate 5-kinase